MVEDSACGGRCVQAFVHGLPDARIGAVIRARSTGYAPGTQDIHIFANTFCGQARRHHSTGAASAASATIQSRNSVIAGVSGFDFSDVSQ